MRTMMVVIGIVSVLCLKGAEGSCYTRLAGGDPSLSGLTFLTGTSCFQVQDYQQTVSVGDLEMSEGRFNLAINGRSIWVADLGTFQEIANRYNVYVTGASTQSYTTIRTQNGNPAQIVIGGPENNGVVQPLVPQWNVSAGTYWNLVPQLGHVYLLQYFDGSSNTQQLVKMFVNSVSYVPNIALLASVEITYDVLYFNPNSQYSAKSTQCFVSATPGVALVTSAPSSQSAHITFTANDDFHSLKSAFIALSVLFSISIAALFVLVFILFRNSNKANYDTIHH